METSASKLLLVVPIYNEAGILKFKLEKLYSYLEDSGIHFHLILSVDDSGDDSVRIVEEFSEVHPSVDAIVHQKKMGRGFAVREAWALHDADFYSFIDADLSTGVDVIEKLYHAAVAGSADVLTASRFVQGATVKRPMLRNLISHIYNFALRKIFHEKIRDHQCGFKTINSKAKEMVLYKTTENSWFWDAELLVLATRCGLSIKEFPVDWVEEKYTHTPLKRLLSDILIHGKGILRLVVKNSRDRKEEHARGITLETNKEITR